MDIFQETLQRYWGYDDFRGIQREIIESIHAHRDTLGLMPTGGGKSITFQVPAMCMDGTCIVVTPLISLMKDQVDHLRQHNIIAHYVNSTMQRNEIVKVLDNCVLGQVKFLYVSPERLQSPIFLKKLQRIKISFITVDEAHCICQWGYDFRPAYLRICDLRQLCPDAPVLALTATATPAVIEDIQQQLLFSQSNVFRMSFERSNLAYVVRQTSHKEAELLHIIQSVKGAAIVYVRSRRHTKLIAEMLQKAGIAATCYHAGLQASEKEDRQNDWQHDKVRVMVATNAFGMGIDKPDVRLVVHADCPNSLEEYFQEAGRAGRDGKKSYAVLLFDSMGDVAKLKMRVSRQFPDKKFVADVYEHLAYFYQIGLGSGEGHSFLFDIEKFCINFHYFPTAVDASLHLLAQSGYIDYESEENSSPRVQFLLDRDELYNYHSPTADEDTVITSLLRVYGGLFSDLIPVSEYMLAQAAKLPEEQVHLTLISLSKRHILKYIPQQHDPLIRYRQRRVKQDDIFIPESVYEHRRKHFALRIQAMLGYATDDHTCRSRQLLAYFGETNKHNCGHCDVCLKTTSTT